MTVEFEADPPWARALNLKNHVREFAPISRGGGFQRATVPYGSGRKDPATKSSCGTLCFASSVAPFGSFVRRVSVSGSCLLYTSDAADE